MPARSPQAVTSSGVTGTYYAAASTTPGDDRVPPGSLLHVKTTGTASNLTLITTGVIDGDLPVSDRTIALPATGERFVRVPANDFYRDASDGYVGLTWSAITGVTFAVLS